MKKILFFLKNACFFSSASRKSSKILLRMSRQKKIHSASERSDDRLSSHAFIFISMFLAKMNFFEGGGGEALIKFYTKPILIEMLFYDIS